MRKKAKPLASLPPKEADVMVWDGALASVVPRWIQRALISPRPRPHAEAAKPLSDAFIPEGDQHMPDRLTSSPVERDADHPDAKIGDRGGDADVEIRKGKEKNREKENDRDRDRERDRDRDKGAGKEKDKERSRQKPLDRDHHREEKDGENHVVKDLVDAVVVSTGRSVRHNRSVRYQNYIKTFEDKDRRAAKVDATSPREHLERSIPAKRTAS